MLPPMDDQLVLGEEAAPRRTPDHRAELAGKMLAGMAVGNRWPSWEKVPAELREFAVEETRKVMDAIVDRAART